MGGGASGPRALRGGKLALGFCRAAAGSPPARKRPPPFAAQAEAAVKTSVRVFRPRLKPVRQVCMLFCVIIQAARPRPLRAMATLADRAAYRQTAAVRAVPSALAREPRARLT